MELTHLDPSKQFCFNSDCPNRGLVGKGNMYVHSYNERRYGCHTCRRTFAATKGTMFYRLRTPPQEVLDAIAQLVVAGGDHSGRGPSEGQEARYGHCLAASGRPTRRPSQLSYGESATNT